MSTDLLESIKSKWNANNLQGYSDHLDKLLHSASTGGELRGLITFYLMDLKRKNAPEYKVAKSEINKFLRRW